MKRLLASWAAAAAMLAIGASGAAAQTYPDRPVTIVVPFAAGGPTDTVTRLVAEAMSKDLGQQIIVENVGGAGGTLGAGRVAQAEPDGYTLLLHHIGMATSATLYRKLAYDTLDDFEYVGLVTEVPMTIVARKDLEPTDLKGLDRLRQGQQGHGDPRQCRHRRRLASVRHAVHERHRHAARHRPVQGHRPGDDRPAGRPGRHHVRPDHQHDQADPGRHHQGLRRDHAKRLDVLPDVPTAEEAGLPGLRSASGTASTRPKGTPEEVVDRLSKALQTALKDPNVVARFAELGTAPASDADATPAALKAKLEGEIARWKPVIEAAGEYAD